MQFLSRIPFVAAIVLLLLAGQAGFAQQEIDPTRWEPAMQAFDEQDRASPPPEGAIVLTGSSSIARWNDQAASALAPLTVIARGFGGSTMQEALYHLDRVALRYKPRAILIYEGDNDTWGRIPEDEIVDNFKQIVAKVHEELPETRVYVMSVKPSVARVDVWPAAQKVNGQLKAIAEADALVHYVDAVTPFMKADGTVMTDIFIDDNLHFNTLGNLIWGSTIRAALMPLEARHEVLH
ncbi:MAG: GDSL-type esterase/lipase family protein [Gammaproteobacteria bacterium]|nr:GDSL-type esterase/lipase family protein [Gammaproteobacteria bacterium]